MLSISLLMSDIANAMRWDFPSGTDGWTGRNCDTSTSGGGNIYCVTNTILSDPGIVSPSNLNLSATQNQIINFSMASQWADSTGYIYFTTTSSLSFDEAKKVLLSVTNNGGWYTYSVDMSTNSAWTGTISQIRIDSALNGLPNKPVGFDWIETKPKIVTPTLSLSKITMQAGEQVILTCDLTSVGAGRTVSFFIQNGSTSVGGSPAQRTANSSGVATWTLGAETNWMPSVSIRCRDESTQVVSAWGGPITINTPTVTPTLSLSKTTMQIGEQVTLTCDLTSVGAGRTVAFFIQNGSTSVGGSPAQRTANSSGVATWTLGAEMNWMPSVSIRCRDESTQVVSAWGGSITINTPTVTPTLSLSKTTMQVGEQVTLTCDLTSVGAGRAVAFFVQNGSTSVGGSPAQRTANSSGVATWTLGAETNWMPSVSIRCRDESTQVVSAWGVPITVTASSISSTWTPLYRSYNSAEKDHFYSTNQNEKNGPVNKSGYTFEKIEAYIYNAQQSGLIPLYRFYYASTKMHYYTTDLGNPSPGYTEGPTIVGYVYPNPIENTVPMYHLEHVTNSDHFFTISDFERKNAAKDFGYNDQGVAFYAARNALNAPLAGKPVVRQNGIDLASGNFIPYDSHVDFSNPPGVAFPFVFARTYNSMNSSDDGPLGPGWTHSYEIKVFEDPINSIAIVTWGNGQDDYYKVNSDGSYTPSQGIYDKLTKTLGSYILTTKDKTKYTFVETIINGNYLGQIVEIKDKNGNTMQFGIDPAYDPPLLAYVIDGSGRRYDFTYTSFADAQARGWKFRRLEKITESNAGNLTRTINFGYDPNDQKGLLTSFTNAEGKITQYGYDSENRLNRIVLPRGNVITANYENGTGQLKNFQADDLQVSLSYNQDITTSTGTIKGTTLTSTTNGISRTISASHDKWRINVNKDGKGNEQRPTAWDNNCVMLPTQLQDGKGKIWRRTYDPNTCNLTSSITPTPLNETTIYTYDTNDPELLRQITDPKNDVVKYEYDGNGNRVKSITVVNGVDRVISITPKSNGQVQSIIDPKGRVTQYDYDDKGYPRLITDNLGKQTISTYDGGGRLLSTTDADGVTMTYTYDNLNQKRTAKDLLNRITNFDYDDNGNLFKVTDPRRVITQYSYTPRDLVETITTAGPTKNVRQAKYAYNDAGQVNKITNALDRSWEIGFDAAGNLTSAKTPLGMIDNFPDYDANGNLQRQVDRSNREIFYTYDEAGRKKTAVITGGPTYKYNYLPDGLVQEIKRGDFTVGRFAYDGRKNLTSYTDPFTDSAGVTVSYTYHEDGQIKTITYPGNKTVTYNYDGRGLLDTVTDWLNRATRYEYSDAGRLKKVLYPNNASIEYVRDSLGHVPIVRNKQGDGTLIVEYAVNEFDPLDAPKQITETGGISQTLAALNESAGYDANNRIQSQGASTFTHNPLGETLTRGATTFTWSNNDLPGLLNNITDGATTKLYAYDGMGNRVSRTVDNVTTRYVLDVSGEMPNVLAETDATGSIKAYYIHGLGLTARVLPNGTTRYYHYDRIGNTVALTDDNGNVTDHYAYANPFAFGMAKDGNTENPFTFVGQHGVMDDGNDIFYMRARYYDAKAGRFFSEDPIGFEGGDLNLYAYVGGNPVVGIDPKGLSTAMSTPEMLLPTKKDSIAQIERNLQYSHLKDNLIQSNLLINEKGLRFISRIIKPFSDFMCSNGNMLGKSNNKGRDRILNILCISDDINNGRNPIESVFEGFIDDIVGKVLVIRMITLKNLGCPLCIM